MSVTIDTAFVKQFNSTIYTLLQQKGGRLRSCVREEPMQGEEQFFEQVGTGTANEVTTRFGDSPVNSMSNDRRRVTLRFFDSGEFIDKFDKVRMLIDPQSVYTQNIVYTLGRCLDDVLLGGADVPGNSSIATYQDGTAGAIFGVAFTGKSAGTQTSFAAGQVVALAFGGTNVGVTVPKLIEGKRLLKAGNVDLDAEELYMYITAKAEADLLNTTQVTSADYNSVMALVRGNVNSFLGINMKRGERAPQSATGAQHWRYPLFVKSGVLLGVAVEIDTRVAERADKKFSWYVYGRAGFGGVRMEEGKAVEIKGLI
jgi:hypothetical protein